MVVAESNAPMLKENPAREAKMEVKREANGMVREK